MAKKDSQTSDLFRGQVPRMPEEYYSGDKPNPHLRSFAEQHLQERPFSPDNDDYDVLAFARPLESTKASAIYNMHTYHQGKKPHDAIRTYIRHFTQPGDLVLDPFSGSGGTALAALFEGRKAIAVDRSPAATFITKNYCTPVDPDELVDAFATLEQKVLGEIRWLYGTRCDRCGGEATTVSTVYSQVFECPRCMAKVPLFDCIEEKSATAKGKAKKIKACPKCHERGFIEEIKTTGEKHGVIPVLVNYICMGACRPARGSRNHEDKDSKKRRFFKEFDVGRIAEIDRTDIPYAYPTHRMMNVPENQRRWGVKWRAGTSNFRTVDELFTKRNLWALAAILHAIDNCPLSDTLQFLFESNILNATTMQQYREAGGGFAKGTYYVPQTFIEREQLGCLRRKLQDILSAEKQIISEMRSTALCISTQSSTDLSSVPSDCVDYIFTDPPYAGTVQYGELNFVWEAWMGFDTHWHDDEIIVNDVRGKDEEDWAHLMRKAMSECYRVLKPGRWLSLCYHDTSEGTWALVQDIMRDAGFESGATESALFIETGQKSYNQLTADKVNKRDLVINFRKPMQGQQRRTTDDQDVSPFSERALNIIREYLSKHPGATRDRVYDELVSRMVHKGQMEAHDFEILLSQVAEEVRETKKKDLFTEEDPDLFGGHEVIRWYLKESEAGAEESDRAVADDVAGRVEKYIVKYTKGELKRTQAECDRLSLEAEKLGQELARPFAEEDKKKRIKLRKDLDLLEKQLAKMNAERDEWAQHALHYSYISEYYFPLQPKPRCTLVELLEDYFFQTEEGNWRPPATDEERKEKADARGRAVRRTLQRFCRMLESGEAIPANTRPDDATLAEWIRHCKRSGMYGQGKLLYEQGGLDLDKLSEEDMVNLEEDYQVCVRMLSRAEQSKPRRRGKE